MAGLVPAISKRWALPCQLNRDRRNESGDDGLGSYEFGAIPGLPRIIAFRFMLL
jgi:hypothetical protein